MKGIKGLPDCYRKDVDSNNYKLLERNQLATSEIRMDIQMVLDCLDLNQARLWNCMGIRWDSAEVY